MVARWQTFIFASHLNFRIEISSLILSFACRAVPVGRAHRPTSRCSSFRSKLWLLRYDEAHIAMIIKVYTHIFEYGKPNVPQIKIKSSEDNLLLAMIWLIETPRDDAVQKCAVEKNVFGHNNNIIIIIIIAKRNINVLSSGLSIQVPLLRSPASTFRYDYQQTSSFLRIVVTFYQVLPLNSSICRSFRYLVSLPQHLHLAHSLSEHGKHACKHVYYYYCHIYHIYHPTEDHVS